MHMRQMLAIVAVLSLALAAACQREQRTGDANVQENVQQALEQAGLQDVNVSEDREKRVISLEGELQSEERKQQAEELARSAAPGYVVANRIGVRPEGMEGRAEDIASDTDKAIESRYQAELTKHRLNEADIKVNVENGVVTLEGEVNNAQQRQQAEQIASDIPDVRQVVNKLAVARQQ